MSIFSRLFGTKQAEQKNIPIEIQNSFTSFNGSLFSNATFRSAVDAIARHAAKLKGQTVVEGCRQPDLHQTLDNLLQTAPNPYMTAYDLLYRAAADYFAQNNAFLYLQRGQKGVGSIYSLCPSSVEFTTCTEGALYVKASLPDGRQATLPYSDIIHLRRHYFNNEMLGADNTPLFPLLETAETLTQATAKAAQNAVNIRGILRFTSLVNPSQVKIEKEQFTKDYLNLSNSGGIATVDQRFDFQPSSIAPYTIPAEHMNAINTQIYSYLGINKAIVDGTFSEDQFASFYESVIEPFALQLSLEFSRKLGVSVVFSSERLEFSSAKTRISLLRELLPFGLISVNEARKLLNLGEVEDGDKRLMSLNFVNTDIANEYQLESEVSEHGKA
jgi:HK97 family phage portal protein